MKKWKATVLLTIVLVITAVLTFIAFANFPVGTKNFNGFLGAIQTDYDLSGGTAYTLTLAKDNEEDVDDINEVLKTLDYRLALLGYKDYSVKAIKNVDNDVKDYDVRIEARGTANQYGEADVSTLAADIAVVAAYGDVIIYGGTEASPTTEILTEGKAIADARYVGAYTGESSTVYQVAITFTDYGYNELMKLMTENSTYYVQINLGENVLLSGSSAISANYFSGKTLVITSPTEANAKQFALQIKTGGLAYKYEISDGEEISSVFGSKIALKCVLGLAGLIVAIAVVMFIFDKGYGLVSCLTSLLSLDIYLFLLIAIPGLKIGIGGVIGFALATVVAAIGYYVTSARIKEEFARGKTLKSAVKTGFNRSIAPIAGGMGISVVAAVILMAFTSGAAYNFAVIYAIGAAVAIAANLLFARMFSALILALNGYKEKFLGLSRAEGVKEVSEEE